MTIWASCNADWQLAYKENAGQHFPYTPIANPRYMMPKWSFGIRPETVQKNVNAARDAGAQIVVLLSHNGFDVDQKLATIVITIVANF